MINALQDPDTYIWPIKYESGVRPPRRCDPRVDTMFDPDPDGGEPAVLPRVQPFLRLAG